MLEFAFMQRALIAALGIGALCGALGFFVVLRRLAFVGVGISHAALGGVALALWLGGAAWLGGFLFALAAALAIAWMGRRGEISEDTAIGILFAASMAFGVAIFSLQPGSSPDLFAALFGNVLAITPLELWTLGGAAAVVGVALQWLFRPLLLLSFDVEIAEAYGHPVFALNAALLALIAGVVMLGVRLVGVILVEALLVIPAATAALWVTHYRSQVLVSAGLGAGAGGMGLAVAYTLDLPAGAAIALTSFGGFVVSLVLRGTRGSAFES